MSVELGIAYMYCIMQIPDIIHFHMVQYSTNVYRLFYTFNIILLIQKLIVLCIPWKQGSLLIGSFMTMLCLFYISTDIIWWRISAENYITLLQIDGLKWS